MNLTKLQSLSVVLLVFAVVWNIAGFTNTVFTLQPRDADSIAGLETVWPPFQEELRKYGYTAGDLGFISAGTLRGEVLQDDLDRRLQLAYVVIPLNLILGRSDTPFVIGEFPEGIPAGLPSNLVPIFNPGKNLVLFKNTASR